MIQTSQGLSAQAGKELIKLKGKPGKDQLHRNWIWIHVELASSHQSRDAFEDLSNINSGREKTCCSHLVWSQSPCNAGAQAEHPSVGPAGLQVTALQRKSCDLANMWPRNAMESKISMPAEVGNTDQEHLDRSSWGSFHSWHKDSSGRKTGDGHHHILKHHCQAPTVYNHNVGDFKTGDERHFSPLREGNFFFFWVHVFQVVW